MLNSEQLREILPHSYPFLLLDQVENIEPGHSLTAIKNITANEWPFTSGLERSSHYPETLLIEAAAQAALVLYRANAPAGPAKPAFIGKVKAEFFSQVAVGDQVSLNVRSSRVIGTGGYSDVEISVGEDKKAEVTAFYSIQPSLSSRA